MPETKQQAKARAKRLGFPLSNVVKGDGSYYIAPHGVKTSASKKAYAESRSSGKSKESSARIAHFVEKKASDQSRRKRRRRKKSK